MAKKAKKILIVEDDRFLVKAYQIKFKKAGIDVVSAMDGVTGLEYAQKESPSLIILDLMLPRMNGFEFLKKIKADEKTRHIPVVTISVLGQMMDHEKAIALGAEEYFIKTDHTIDEIVEKIKSYIK